TPAVAAAPRSCRASRSAFASSRELPAWTTSRTRDELGLDDGDAEADGGEDVAAPDDLRLRAALDPGFAGVVALPGDLPALGLRATDRLLELPHDLLERVTVAVVQDRHPGWGDGFLTDLLDVRLGRDPFGHHPRVSRAPAGRI